MTKLIQRFCRINEYFIKKEATRLNRIFKVIFNRAKGQYQVVSELAKNGGKTSGNSLLKSFTNSGGTLTRSILTAILVFGITYGGNAEVVNDGDVLNAGTNISIVKDDATKTITVSADGVATSTELEAVKNDVQKKPDRYCYQCWKNNE